MLRMYFNCRTFSTGLSDPHSINLDGHNISIVRTNELNEKVIMKYYLVKLKMTKYANATDTKGRSYTIYTQYKHNPFYSIIAIPDKV